MNLPNWFKIVWWLLILSICCSYLVIRSEPLLEGNVSGIDALVILIWFALMLVPIFKQIDIFGIRLKQEINSIKNDLERQIISLQSQVSTTVRTEFSPSFNIPPPDSQLPNIESQINEALSVAFKEYGLEPAVDSKDIFVDEDVSFLFSVRFHLEKEVRRIWKLAIQEGWLHHVDVLDIRPLSVRFMVSRLSEAQLLKSGIASGVLKVYSVCSPAVHGEKVSTAQLSFVRDIAQKLLAALKEIK